MIVLSLEIIIKLTDRDVTKIKAQKNKPLTLNSHRFERCNLNPDPECRIPNPGTLTRTLNSNPQTPDP